MVARKVGCSRGDALSLDSFLLQFTFNFDGYLRENKRIECLITLLMIFWLSLSGPGDEQQTAGIITTPLLLASTGMSAETKACKILDHLLRQPSALQLQKLKLWNHDGSLDRVDKTLSEAVILIHPILMSNVDCVCGYNRFGLCSIDCGGLCVTFADYPSPHSGNSICNW